MGSKSAPSKPAPPPAPPLAPPKKVARKAASDQSAPTVDGERRVKGATAKKSSTFLGQLLGGGKKGLLGE